MWCCSCAPGQVEALHLCCLHQALHWQHLLPMEQHHHHQQQQQKLLLILQLKVDIQRNAAPAAMLSKGTQEQLGKGPYHLAAAPGLLQLLACVLHHEVGMCYSLSNNDHCYGSPGQVLQQQLMLSGAHQQHQQLREEQQLGELEVVLQALGHLLAAQSARRGCNSGKENLAPHQCCCCCSGCAYLMAQLLEGGLWRSASRSKFYTSQWDIRMQRY